MMRIPWILLVFVLGAAASRFMTIGGEPHSGSSAAVRGRSHDELAVSVRPAWGPELPNLNSKLPGRHVARHEGEPSTETGVCEYEAQVEALRAKLARQFKSEGYSERLNREITFLQSALDRTESDLKVLEESYAALDREHRRLQSTLFQAAGSFP